ncbi:hypothetical protein F4780DRAFT_499312 [Xylariomycetidae sp. FL0641]|nr:hypothetical protein F4780DRAFT_499312 [Xylariomycetidae sp. FL0641]
MSSFVNLEHLGPEHLAAASKAIRNVISTEVAEFTFSQIVDGMPTLLSYLDFHSFLRDHPIGFHEALCDGPVEKTRQLRANFDLLSLTFDSRFLQTYQNSEFGSAMFELLLIELTAIACHQIAVGLYVVDDGAHKHSEHEKWLSEAISRVPEDRPYARRLLPPPTLFYHRSYKASDQYPNGIADMAGYWAEAKIFGGVVVFDRGESESEINSVWLHPNSRDAPATLFTPTETQYRAIVKFLLHTESEHDACPLPILATDENRPRYDPYDAFAYCHIFRNRYERKLCPPEKRRPRHKIRDLDWPEVADRWIVDSQWMTLARGEPINEAEIAAAKERMRNITPSSPCWVGPKPWETGGR